MNYPNRNVVAFTSTCFTFESVHVVASLARSVVCLPIFTSCICMLPSFSLATKLSSVRLPRSTLIVHLHVHNKILRLFRNLQLPLNADQSQQSRNRRKARNLNALTLQDRKTFGKHLLIFREHSRVVFGPFSFAYNLWAIERVCFCLSRGKYEKGFLYSENYFFYLCLRKFNEPIYTHFFSSRLLSMRSNDFIQKPSKKFLSLRFCAFLSLFTQDFLLSFYFRV